ncbi:hypothetical protein QFC20_004093 [Naganishia adeliensis]|uniref:Uncharacterized protein n=1 Tax=Naganishia adeliensis TaxID=92952 RepID=A0ACC2W3K1_9TREE|nr:hypothetical protein QFC20_004093 [Naganishia adeliensis]
MSSINAADKEPRESEIRHQSSQQSWRDSSDSFARLPPQETQARSSFDQARLDETAPQRYSTPSGFRERTPREGQRELPAEPVASKTPPLSWRAVHLNATDHNSVESARPPTSHREGNSGAMSIRSFMGASTPVEEQGERDQESRRAEGELDVEGRLRAGMPRRTSHLDNRATELGIARHLVKVLFLIRLGTS